MTVWKVALSGANAYIPLFPFAFVGTQLRVTHDDEGRYYLTADSLDAIDDIDVARTHAQQLVEALNGLAELIWPGFVPKCSTPYMIGRQPVVPSIVSFAPLGESVLWSEVTLPVCSIALSINRGTSSQDGYARLS